MFNKDDSVIPQPKCPVKFEILAANVQAVEENSKIGNRSKSPLCKRECLKGNHGYTHIIYYNEHLSSTIILSSLDLSAH